MSSTVCEQPANFRHQLQALQPGRVRAMLRRKIEFLRIKLEFYKKKRYIYENKAVILQALSVYYVFWAVTVTV